MLYGETMTLAVGAHVCQPAFPPPPHRGAARLRVPAATHSMSQQEFPHRCDLKVVQFYFVRSMPRAFFFFSSSLILLSVFESMCREAFVQLFYFFFCLVRVA